MGPQDYGSWTRLPDFIEFGSVCTSAKIAWAGLGVSSPLTARLTACSISRPIQRLRRALRRLILGPAMDLIKSPCQNERC